MFTKKISTLCLLMMMLGCKEQKTTNQTPPSPTPVASKKAPAPLTILMAKSTTVPQQPKRIISLAPNITEIVFALGQGDKLKGVTRFCDYPATTKDLPKVGGLIDPDVEAMLAQRPDLILGMASGPKGKLTKQLDAAKLPYMFFRMKSIEDTYKGIELIGKQIGATKRAQKLVKDMKAKMLLSIKKEAGPKTLFVLGHKPIFVAGPGSFGAQLIERAGGQNAVNGKKAYMSLDMEKVIALNPDVIIDATMTAGAGDTKLFWTKHKSINAVKMNRVYQMHNPALLRPGPRLPMAFELMKEMISKQSTLP